MSKYEGMTFYPEQKSLRDFNSYLKVRKSHSPKNGVSVILVSGYTRGNMYKRGINWFSVIVKDAEGYYGPTMPRTFRREKDAKAFANKVFKTIKKEVK